jgi:hypothetical protein
MEERQSSMFHKEGLTPCSSLDLAFPLLCFEYTHRTLSLFHLVPKYSLNLNIIHIFQCKADAAFLIVGLKSSENIHGKALPEAKYLKSVL